METIEIPVVNLLFAYTTIAVTFFIFFLLKVNLYRQTIIAFSRMSAQLVLVGLYLTFFFELNNPFVNAAYITLMIGAANLNVLHNSGLKVQVFFFTFPALFISLFSVLSFYVLLVFRPEPLYDARYVIPVAGMLLGNSMTRTIITLERFYTSIRKDPDGFASRVCLGASTGEAIMPYLRTAYRAGIAPALARTATMGLVSLPGMMTGQILGGSLPVTAIKYQIVIILAIFMTTELSTVLAVLFSLKRGFNRYGYLDESMFKG